jgi:hypothetical protein
MTAEHTDDRALLIANRIARASSHEWPGIFEELRRRRRLSATVRHLNQLLDEPDHRELAKLALKRIGLDHTG